MFQLTETQKMVQDVLRQYVTGTIQPKVQDMEDGVVSCNDLARDMFRALRVADMIRPSLEKLARKREENSDEKVDITGLVSPEGGGMEGGDPMLMMIFLKEISRVSPGMAMSLGVTAGLAGGAIVSRGTAAQVREYGIPLMTLEKTGSWCLTEPGAGSDAFGGMQTRAKPDGRGGYVLNGSKTFITNAPVADILVVYAKLDTGQPPRDRPVLSFILERGMKGLSTGAPFHKLGMRDSPTSEVFMEDVRLEKRHLIGETETRGGRTHGHQGQPGDRAVRRIRHLPGHHRALLRGMPQVREGARPVREAHRRFPGRAAAARPHVYQLQERGEYRLPHRVDAEKRRPGRQLHQRVQGLYQHGRRRGRQ